MKLITLHEPYASLIARGIKTYETRHWKTYYQGQILIHAAQKKINSSGRDLLEKLSHLPNCPSLNDMQYGNIVALATLSDCLWICSDNPNATVNFGRISVDSISETERLCGNWTPARYALKLENVSRLVNPVFFKSAQGKLLDVTSEWEKILERASFAL